MADLRKEELFPADAFGLFYLQITRIPGGWHRHAEYEIFYHMHSKIPSEISDSTVRALRGFFVSRNRDQISIIPFSSFGIGSAIRRSTRAETGPADKQVEDAQFPAVLQKAVCSAPAQKNGEQNVDPLIHFVTGTVLLPVGIFLQSTHDDVLLLMRNTGFLFGLVQLILQMCHLAQAGFVFIAALEAGNNRPDIKGGNAHFL